MNLGKRLSWIVLLLGLAGFVAGMVHLFQLRFETGDVYPPYSSLRADPLGTMAFFESLEYLPDLSVERDYSTQNRLPDGPRTAYLHLAAEPSSWRWMEDDLVREIDRFVLNGGRFVVTFQPQTHRSYTYSASTNAAKTGATNTAAPPKSARRMAFGPGEGFTTLKEHWGFGFGFVPLRVGGGDSFESVKATNRTSLELPASIAWHSGLVLTNLADSWRVIYSRDAHPVLAERSFGAGTIVLATDSFFVSNQALRHDRHADLLAWLLGSASRICFDEAHLGVVETPGVSTLLRKYHLYWLAAALLLLALLFVWRNAFSFLPPHPDTLRRDYVTGKDAAAGFNNLLRRNIAPRDLLRVCFAEWTKSLSHDSAHPISRVDKAQTIAQSQTSNPVQAYRDICSALKKSS
jgi:hypothetical protein